MEKRERIRRVHRAAFKATVALEAIKETKTIAELVSIYSVHPTQIKQWKQQVLEGLQDMFSEKGKQKEKDTNQLTQILYQQIGKQKVEIDWLKKKIGLIEQEFSITG
jgi:transposase